MIRPVAVIVSAILFSRPGMPKDEAARYAVALNEAASEYSFDPLTAVAIIHFETRFQPRLVSPDGEDHGIGQVRARFVGACKDDEDPVFAPSEACKAVKESLLDGVTNIRRMGLIIGANQDFCKKKTGTARAEQWLAGYQGYTDVDRKRWCKPGPKTWQVLGYAKELVAKVAPVKAKASPKSADAAKSTSKASPKAASKAASKPVTKPVTKPLSKSEPGPAPAAGQRRQDSGGEARRIRQPAGAVTRPRRATSQSASTRKEPFTTP